MTVQGAAARTLQSFMVRQAVRAGDVPPDAGLKLADELDDCVTAELIESDHQRRPDGDTVDRRLCEFLGVVLGRRGPDVHDYLSPALSYGPQSLAGNRHMCGARLLTMRLAPRWLTAGGRDLSLCERCGFAANRSADETAPESVTVVGGCPALTITGPPGGWATGAVQPIGGHIEPTTLPVTALCAMDELFHLPVPPASMPGLRRAAVAVVRSGDYQILQVPVGVCPKRSRE